MDLAVVGAIAAARSSGLNPDGAAASELSDKQKQVRVKRAELPDAMRVSLGVADAPKAGRLARLQAWQAARNARKSGAGRA